LDDIILNRRGHRPRKGAPHTFDVAGFEVLLQRIRAREPDIAIPVFDRTMELSRAAADIVNATDRFMIVEGNYLLLKSAPWDRLKPLFDVTLFLDVPLSEIERRLTGRILAHGHDAAYARHWIESNDLLNVRDILANSAEPDIRIAN
jgi:pantothenate kinase